MPIYLALHVLFAKPRSRSWHTLGHWTPRQEEDARKYMDAAEAGKRSVKQLREHMLSKNHLADSLPTLPQMSTWMRNFNCRKKQSKKVGQPAAAGREVAPTQVALNNWPRDGSASEDLYVLEPRVVSSTEVFVPYTCKGMLSTLSRFVGDEVNLAVDAKMKVLNGGAGVATLSLLVKDGLRSTDVNAGAGRVQGKAFTTRAMPFLQATMHQETTANYVRLFAVAETLWAQCCPSQLPLKQCVRQLHKDFAPAIEAARREAFPNSRPCDDWFHFKQKRRELESRCKHLEMRAGKYCKAHADWLMSCLQDIRLAPTLQIFSLLWEGMLRAWLQAQYAVPVPSVLVSKNPAWAGRSFAAFWVGVKGIWPGSGSGNESAEALHSSWQCLAARATW